jgi:secondary thiamine-phosphate synthase enzyme
MRLPSLQIASRAACELLDVTAQVEAALPAAGAAGGLLLVFCPHTTAGVTIQENADPEVRRDLLLALENAVPRVPPRGRFHHAEGNSDAHAKAALVGSSAALPVRDGRLLLGTWQGVYLCEFDGPRVRTLHLELIPG